MSEQRGRRDDKIRFWVYFALWSLFFFGGTYYLRTSAFYEQFLTQNIIGPFIIGMVLIGVYVLGAVWLERKIYPLEEREKWKLLPGEKGKLLLAVIGFSVLLMFLTSGQTFTYLQYEIESPLIRFVSRFIYYWIIAAFGAWYRNRLIRNRQAGES